MTKSGDLFALEPLHSSPIKCVASSRSPPASDAIESRKTRGDGLLILRRPRQKRAVSPSSLETVMQSVSSGAAGSWSLCNLGARMIAGNFEPGFFVEHFLKDMNIALAESRRMKLALPGLALAEQLYRAVEAQGYGRKGTQALLLALADISRVDWPKRPG